MRPSRFASAIVRGGHADPGVYLLAGTHALCGGTPKRAPQSQTQYEVSGKIMWEAARLRIPSPQSQNPESYMVSRVKAWLRLMARALRTGRSTTSREMATATGCGTRSNAGVPMTTTPGGRALALRSSTASTPRARHSILKCDFASIGRGPAEAFGIFPLPEIESPLSGFVLAVASASPTPPLP